EPISRSSTREPGTVIYNATLSRSAQRTMSFRKRNAPLAGTPDRGPRGSSPSVTGAKPVPLGDEGARATDSAGKERSAASALASGVRPSPLDGRPTTSTGTRSLDGLLAGHAGLALGNSLLIEEEGTTDYAGTLLRYYAAEGVVQGHRVHVVGLNERWGRELPGLVGAAGEAGERGRGSEPDAAANGEKMRIAWRYERLGQFGEKTGGAASARGGRLSPVHRNFNMLLGIALLACRVPIADSTLVIGPPGSPGNTLQSSTEDSRPVAFCHTFDLTKRLALPSPNSITYVPLGPPSDPTSSPFSKIVPTLIQHLASTPSQTIHRLLLPILLSPALYPPSASHPHTLLPFLHSLRALLRRFPTRLTVLLALPLSLYPRSTGLTRWIELLSDGVVELVPFPHTVDAGPPLTAGGAATKEEERPQGMVRVHRLPVFHEKGGGGGTGVGDDLAFTVSRRKFVIKPFSLPPIEGDTEAQRGATEEGGGGVAARDIEF
ncbi:MAG: hypothetical protein LQ340_007424, partial [Diploschistes diacapsis]